MAQAEGWTWKCCFSVFLLHFAMSGIDSTSLAGTNIIAFRSETTGDSSRMENGQLVVGAGKIVEVRLYGTGLSGKTRVSFTTRDENCNDLESDIVQVKSITADGTSALMELQMNEEDIGEEFFMCVEEEDDFGNGTDRPSSTWRHQGKKPWMQLRVEHYKKTFLPLPLQVIVIIILLIFSGLFSGLNLGLMSLDKTELQIIENCGTATEKSHAKKIFPLRKRGNFLLCTILLGNVMVNNTLTIFMDNITGSGAAAVVSATLGIVIFGEIIPQAVCSRHGLAVGAHTIWITKFFMLLTFPLSFPISKILDCVLGEEVGAVYNRDRLRELLKVTEENMDLVKDEFHIIAGALELSKKTVKDVMTKIEDVYMISYDGCLDFDTMNEIMKTGYTRVPVYEGEKSNIIALLNIKDLAFVDPDDKIPLKTVCNFYKHPLNYVFEDTKLDVMLEEFKKGRSHMSFVQRVNNEGEGDPFYETMGVVTLEDVIEEILQAEIVDETDTVTDNRAKKRRKAQTKDFSVFNQPDEQNRTRLSPQLALATFQYLSTTVPPFRSELISDTVLQRMLRQNIILDLKVNDPRSDENYLYQRGKACDYFIMILQGRIEVDIGKEHMIFEGGPFIYFGVQALTGSGDSLTHTPSYSSLDSASDVYSKPVNYVPDFNVKAIGDIQYIKVRRAFYLAAYRATLMERSPKKDDISSQETLEDPFTREWRRATSVAPDSHPRLDQIESPEKLNEVITSNHANKEKPERTNVKIHEEEEDVEEDKEEGGDDAGRRDEEVSVEIEDIKINDVKEDPSV